MLKLQQLKAKQAAAKKAAAEKESAGAGAGAAAGEGAGAGGFVLKRQSSKELAESRRSKSKENVFTLKSSGGAGRGKKGGKKANAAELRAQKDVSEMEPVRGAEVKFPDPDNLMNFDLHITPYDGLWKGATFLFKVVVPQTYPYDPPKVREDKSPCTFFARFRLFSWLVWVFYRLVLTFAFVLSSSPFRCPSVPFLSSPPPEKVSCETPIYHPNIDWEGHVCLNILRAEWMPVLNLHAVVFGIMTLFLEPNPDDPLNKEAADDMVKRRSAFDSDVRSSLQGQSVKGHTFPKLI
jgi:ubiquitin-conjugating enzyme E2 M